MRSLSMTFARRTAAVSAAVAMAWALPVWGAVREVGSGKTYATITAAMAAAQTNDEIVVYPGTYTEIVNIYKNGSTLRGAGGGAAKIVGFINVGSSLNVTLSGLEVASWTNTSYHGILQANGSGLTVTNCHIHHGASKGVYSRNSTRLLVCNNDIHDCMDTAVNLQSAHATDGTYETGAIIRDNYLHDNGADGVSFNGQYITVSGNTVVDNINTNWQSTHPDGLQIIGSTVDGFTAAQHVRICNNLFRNHTQNIFASGSKAGVDSDCDDLNIYNNVAYNDAGVVHGVNLAAISGCNVVLWGVKNAKIHGNSFGQVSTAGIYAMGECGPGSILIKNNIIANSATNPSSMGVYFVEAGDAAPGTDYNLYFCKGYDVRAGAAWYTTVAGFATATSLDTHSIHVDPLLDGWPSVQPLPGSPAVDMGASLAAPFTVDKAGVARPQGTGWDVGAYEVLESTPSPPTNLHIIP